MSYFQKYESWMWFIETILNPCNIFLSSDTKSMIQLQDRLLNEKISFFRDEQDSLKSGF